MDYLNSLSINYGTDRIAKWTGQDQIYSMDNLEFPNMPNPCPEDRHYRTTVEDILCMKRPSFLPNYKNPCWFEDKRLRCLPYFHIIGVPKSATTDLYNRLTKHPDVVVNRGLIQGKETWYWSWARYNLMVFPGESAKVMKFTEFVDKFAGDVIEKKHVQGYHPQITGHGDPMDFADFHFNTNIPQNDAHGEELVWTTPYLIKHVNPGVKLVLMLRDPVERLYSYYFFRKRGWTSADFDRDVLKSLSVWLNCIRDHSYRHCLYDIRIKKQMKVPLYSSFYSSHLKEWLEVFPRQQIFVWRTEDYEKDTRGTLMRLFKFLNINPSTESSGADVPFVEPYIALMAPNSLLLLLFVILVPAYTWSSSAFYVPPVILHAMLSNRRMDAIIELPKSLVTSRKLRAGPMSANTKSLLVRLYRNSTIELAKLLNDERFAFEDVSFS